MDKPLCILRIVNGEITGWFLAPDTHDARRHAYAIGEHALAEKLYRTEFPAPGRHDLGDGFIMLVG
jgi:hypothetical protein